MDSDQFDIEVPDTIPAYITRRHEKPARRTVTRAASGPASVRPMMPGWLAATLALASVAGIVVMWTVWPSPTTFVVVPTVALVAGVCAVTFSVVRRTGLHRL